mmetsp:Transcript_18391/g.31443  ORF Transcript_18391/g.31443 Transcript_18391/m.31443 type:complete len:98 (-) Transcript_18391:40-333(-)
MQSQGVGGGDPSTLFSSNGSMMGLNKAGMQTNMMMSSSQCGNQFKIRRYNLQELFDDNYGHLQRNELLMVQRQEDKAVAITSQHKSPSVLNVFVLDE